MPERVVRWAGTGHQVLSNFDIVGSLLDAFRTRSSCDRGYIVDGSPVTLHNPPTGPDGRLTFGARARNAKIVCG